MEIIVNPHNLTIYENNIINAGEYNITQVNFEFSKEYTSDLVKKAIFIGDDNKAYEMVINNDECMIPSEILIKKQLVTLGVYAYKITDSELTLRYSPSPIIFQIRDGSYKTDSIPSEEITPSQYEQYMQALQDGLNELQEALDSLGNIDDLQDRLIPDGGNSGQVLSKKSNTDYDVEWINVSGGDGSTTDYSQLTNKPSINDVELVGNKTLDDLGIQPKGNYVIDADYVHTDNNYSDEDKTKLDGLSNYTLPKASDSTLGGIMIGDNLNIDGEGKVSVIVTDGEDGATFTPSVDDSGNLSWTNDKSLPNPEPVNIKGPKGDPGEQGKQGEQGLPGPTGPGVPTGGTTGQVLSKVSDVDYDTVWKNVEGGGSQGITIVNGDKENPIDLSTLTETGIYVCDGYWKPRNQDTENANPIILFVQKNLNGSSNQWYIKPKNNNYGTYAIRNIVNEEFRIFENAASYTGAGDNHKSVSTSLLAKVIGNDMPLLSTLQTTDKSSLIAAINELNTRLAALEGTGE